MKSAATGRVHDHINGWIAIVNHPIQVWQDAGMGIRRLRSPCDLLRVHCASPVHVPNLGSEAFVLIISKQSVGWSSIREIFGNIDTTFQFGRHIAKR